MHHRPIFIVDDKARITAQAVCPKHIVNPPIISGKTGAPFSHLPDRWEGGGAIAAAGTRLRDEDGRGSVGRRAEGHGERPGRCVFSARILWEAGYTPTASVWF